ncbi:hypothetical protein JNM87_03495, partial [Candidatus Saccharibacteria bacterium]|nr:hypothetical protein [Candidatus Saccharibacteria bacterium]
IGAKMYETASAEAESQESGDKSQDESTDSKKKKGDKDSPIEGEVVDEK